VHEQSVSLRMLGFQVAAEECRAVGPH